MYSTIFRIEKLIASTRKSAIGRWHVASTKVMKTSHGDFRTDRDTASECAQH